MNKQNLECVNITNDTKIESKEKNLNDTTKKWERKCPKCNEIVYHTSKRNRNVAVKKNQMCGNCQRQSLKKENKSRICPICKDLVFYKYAYMARYASRKPCKKCSYKIKDYKISDETREKISKSVKCVMKNFPIEKLKEMERKRLEYFSKPETLEKMRIASTGRVVDEETRKKHRISIINHLINKNGKICPGYNKQACEFIDKYAKQNGYNFQHALNGGEYYIKELGYFVDGYDKEKNVVFEYDEPHHIYVSSGKLKERDIIRMNLIKKHLNNCKFIRYNERLNEIKEY